MKKASEYSAHARECRKLASRMELGKDRELLLRMAADWERLARDRAELIRRNPELAALTEEAEPSDEDA
jgi:hypothetical protein